MCNGQTIHVATWIRHSSVCSESDDSTDRLGWVSEDQKKLENRLLECTHSAEFNPKLLKALVQKFRNSAEKFENRLLGSTNQHRALISACPHTQHTL